MSGYSFASPVVSLVADVILVDAVFCTRMHFSQISSESGVRTPNHPLHVIAPADQRRRRQTKRKTDRKREELQIFSVGLNATVRTMALRRLPVLLALFFFIVAEEAHRVQAILVSHNHGPSPLSKWQEKVYRQRMTGCYQDINIGLRGEACKASAIDMENCAMECLSPDCYESIYGTDPLEEGELDLRRGREFRYCVRQAEARKAKLEASLAKA